MRYYTKYFFIFIISVAAFLTIRQWLDRKRGKTQDIDIVRADADDSDSHLGSWAQKNDSALLMLRFKREDSFLYTLVSYPSNDTLKYIGYYKVMPSIVNDKGLQYPHMIAISNKGDTIINHFIQMQRATKRNVDILSLKTDNGPDAKSMLFYRIEQ